MYTRLSATFISHCTWFNFKKCQVIFRHLSSVGFMIRLSCMVLLCHKKRFFFISSIFCRFKCFSFFSSAHSPERERKRHGDDATMIWYCIPIRLVCAMKKKLKWISTWEMALVRISLFGSGYLVAGEFNLLCLTLHPCAFVFFVTL